jgi:hypothetical protein
MCLIEIPWIMIITGSWMDVEISEIQKNYVGLIGLLNILAVLIWIILN